MQAYALRRNYILNNLAKKLSDLLRRTFHARVYFHRSSAAQKLRQNVDIAKRLLDMFSSSDVLLSPVISGALMIEPTETDTPETLDSFVEAS